MLMKEKKLLGLKSPWEHRRHIALGWKALKGSKTCWAGQPLRLPSLGWIAHSGHGSRSNLLGWKALKKSKTCWAGQPLRLTSLIRKQSLELASLQESQRHMLGWTALKTY